MGFGSLFPESVSRCAVRAAGVPVEWIEATAASIGQLTLIYLHRCGHWASSHWTAGSVAGTLAAATRGRVLMVCCDGQSKTSAVDDGVAAYRWLLGEGVNLNATALLADRVDSLLSESVRVSASQFGLPLPQTIDLHLPRWLRCQLSGSDGTNNRFDGGTHHGR